MDIIKNGRRTSSKKERRAQIRGKWEAVLKNEDLKFEKATGSEIHYQKSPQKEGDEHLGAIL